MADQYTARGRPAGCNEESPSVARGSTYFREKTFSLLLLLFVSLPLIPLCPLVWPYVSLKRVVSCPRREPRLPVSVSFLPPSLHLFLSSFFVRSLCPLADEAFGGRIGGKMIRELEQSTRLRLICVCGVRTWAYVGEDGHC